MPKVMLVARGDLAQTRDITETAAVVVWYSYVVEMAYTELVILHIGQGPRKTKTYLHAQSLAGFFFSPRAVTLNSFTRSRKKDDVLPQLCSCIHVR